MINSRTAFLNFGSFWRSFISAQISFFILSVLIRFRNLFKDFYSCEQQIEKGLTTAGQIGVAIGAGMIMDENCFFVSGDKRLLKKIKELQLYDKIIDYRELRKMIEEAI